MTVSISETIGGITIDDPYRWLEDDTLETRAWQERQNAVAEERIRSWPHLERLRAAVAARRHESAVFAPMRFGGRWFRLVATEPGRAPALCIGADAGGCERVLVDPDSWPGTAPSLDWHYPSPDGEYVVFGISERGSEQSVLHVVETESGRLLDERLPFASFGVVAWLPDSSGFFYNAGLGPDTAQPRKRLFFHALGETSQRQPEAAIVREDEDFVYPQLSPDGRWLAAVSSEVEPRPDSIRDLAGGGGWEPFLIGFPGSFAGFFHGDRYLAVTTDGAPRGRLVSIPIERPRDRSAWEELVPEGAGAMRTVALAGDTLAVVDLVDTSSRIRLFSLDGRLEGEVSLPGPGTVGLHHGGSNMISEPMVSTADGELLFVHSTFTAPPVLHRYVAAEGRLEALSGPGPALEDVEAELRRCRSRDGVEISFWLVRRGSQGGPRPTLLYGYGGWNIAWGLPAFLGELAPFVEAGGALVFPHLRGGGERGEVQWHSGRLEHKQRTFDDLYAVAETLIRDGVTTRNRLALVGASNGGLLAGAALTQRPGLFRVVVPLVPLLDLMRHPRDPYLAEYAVEYGEPSDPAFAPILHSYSPCHNVRDGERYPAVLVVCGDSDIRCPAWHGRKLVARLQPATVSDRPVLYRLLESSGHRSTPAASTHEWLGFVMAELGMVPS